MADLSISGASPLPHIESDIRINYGDPNKIIAAANCLTPPPLSECTRATPCNLEVYCSVDGGATWSRSRLPSAPSPSSESSDSGDAFQSDPAVDWTSDGTAWALTIGGSGPTEPSYVRSFISTDFGKTWTFDATVSEPLTPRADRDIVWVDHSSTSPYKDQVYVTWFHDVPFFSAVFFARRTAGLGGAWQAPKQLSFNETTGQATGGDIKTNGVGDIFVFWPDVCGSGNILVAKSTDGGATFGEPIVIAQTFATTHRLTIPAAPRLPRPDGGSTKGVRVYVSAGAYRTAAKDLVYAVWTDLSGAPGCTAGNGPGVDGTSACARQASCKTRVWFARSTDGGAAWSTPVKLNDQASLNDQFHARLCVDASNGNLLVTYRDTVNDRRRLQTDVWMQTSTDDGQTWSAAVQVNSQPSDETTPGADPDQYGDYDGLTGHAGTFFLSWTDRRNGGAEEIWTARISLA